MTETELTLVAFATFYLAIGGIYALGLMRRVSDEDASDWTIFSTFAPVVLTWPVHLTRLMLGGDDD